MTERPPSDTGEYEGGRAQGAPGRRWCSRKASGVLDRRDVEVQLDLVGDQDAAGLQRGVPGEAPLGTQDLRLALEADALVAEGVLGRTVELQVDAERLGGAEDRQVAGDPVLVAA